MEASRGMPEVTAARSERTTTGRGAVAASNGMNAVLQPTLRVVGDDFLLQAYISFSLQSCSYPFIFVLLFSSIFHF